MQPSIGMACVLVELSGARCGHAYAAVASCENSMRAMSAQPNRLPNLRQECMGWILGGSPAAPLIRHKDATGRPASYHPRPPSTLYRPGPNAISSSIPPKIETFFMKLICCIIAADTGDDQKL